jgi:hypothetical protein
LRDGLTVRRPPSAGDRRRQVRQPGCRR